MIHIIDIQNKKIKNKNKFKTKMKNIYKKLLAAFLSLAIILSQSILSFELVFALTNDLTSEEWLTIWQIDYEILSDDNILLINSVDLDSKYLSDQNSLVNFIIENLIKNPSISKIRIADIKNTQWSPSEIWRKINSILATNHPLLSQERIDTKNAIAVNWNFANTKAMNDHTENALVDKFTDALKVIINENLKKKFGFDIRVIKSDYKNFAFALPTIDSDLNPLNETELKQLYNNNEEILISAFWDITSKKEFIELILDKIDSDIQDFTSRNSREKEEVKNVLRNFDIWLSKYLAFWDADKKFALHHMEISWRKWRGETEFSLHEYELSDTQGFADTTIEIEQILLSDYIDSNFSIWWYEFPVFVEVSNKELEMAKTAFFDLFWVSETPAYIKEIKDSSGNLIKRIKLNATLLRSIRKEKPLDQKDIEDHVKNYINALNAWFDFFDPSIWWGISEWYITEINNGFNIENENYWEFNRNHFLNTYKNTLSKRAFFESTVWKKWLHMSFDIVDLWVLNLESFRALAERMKTWWDWSEQDLIKSWLDITKRFIDAVSQMQLKYPSASFTLWWDEILVFIPWKIDEDIEAINNEFETILNGQALRSRVNARIANVQNWTEAKLLHWELEKMWAVKEIETLLAKRWIELSTIKINISSSIIWNDLETLYPKLTTDTEWLFNASDIDQVINATWNPWTEINIIKELEIPIMQWAQVLNKVLAINLKYENWVLNVGMGNADDLLEQTFSQDQISSLTDISNKLNDFANEYHSNTMWWNQNSISMKIENIDTWIIGDEKISWNYWEAIKNIAYEIVNWNNIWYSVIDGSSLLTFEQRLASWNRILSKINDYKANWVLDHELKWFLERPRWPIDKQFNDNIDFEDSLDFEILFRFNSMFVSANIIPELLSVLNQETLWDNIKNIHTFLTRWTETHISNLFFNQKNIIWEFRSNIVEWAASTPDHKRLNSELIPALLNKINNFFAELEILKWKKDSWEISLNQYVKYVLKTATYFQHEIVWFQMFADWNKRSSRAVYEFIIKKFLWEDSKFTSLPVVSKRWRYKDGRQVLVYANAKKFDSILFERGASRYPSSMKNQRSIAREVLKRESDWEVIQNKEQEVNSLVNSLSNEITNEAISSLQNDSFNDIIISDNDQLLNDYVNDVLSFFGLVNESSMELENEVASDEVETKTVSQETVNNSLAQAEIAYQKTSENILKIDSVNYPSDFSISIWDKIVLQNDSVVEIININATQIKYALNWKEFLESKQQFIETFNRIKPPLKVDFSTWEMDLFVNEEWKKIKSWELININAWWSTFQVSQINVLAPTSFIETFLWKELWAKEMSLSSLLKLTKFRAEAFELDTALKNLGHDIDAIFELNSDPSLIAQPASVWPSINNNLPSLLTNNFSDITLLDIHNKLFKPMMDNEVAVRNWLIAARNMEIKTPWSLKPLTLDMINEKINNNNLARYLETTIPNVLKGLIDSGIVDQNSQLSILSSIANNIPKPMGWDQRWPSGKDYWSNFETSMLALSQALPKISEAVWADSTKVQIVLNEIFWTVSMQTEYYLKHIDWIIEAANQNGIDLANMTAEQKNVILEFNPNNFPKSEVYLDLVKERINPNPTDTRPVVVYMVNSADKKDISAMVARMPWTKSVRDAFSSYYISPDGEKRIPPKEINAPDMVNNLQRLHDAGFRVVYAELTDPKSIWDAIKEATKNGQKINSLVMNLHGSPDPSKWYLLSSNDHAPNTMENWDMRLTEANMADIGISNPWDYFEANASLLSLSCSSGSEEYGKDKGIAKQLGSHLNISPENIVAPNHTIYIDPNINIELWVGNPSITWVDFSYDQKKVDWEMVKVYESFKSESIYKSFSEMYKFDYSEEVVAEEAVEQKVWIPLENEISELSDTEKLEKVKSNINDFLVIDFPFLLNKIADNFTTLQRVYSLLTTVLTYSVDFINMYMTMGLTVEFVESADWINSEELVKRDFSDVIEEMSQIQNDVNQITTFESLKNNIVSILWKILAVINKANIGLSLELVDSSAVQEASEVAQVPELVVEKVVDIDVVDQLSLDSNHVDLDLSQIDSNLLKIIPGDINSQENINQNIKLASALHEVALDLNPNYSTVRVKLNDVTNPFEYSSSNNPVAVQTVTFESKTNRLFKKNTTYTENNKTVNDLSISADYTVSTEVETRTIPNANQLDLSSQLVNASLNIQEYNSNSKIYEVNKVTVNSEYNSIDNAFVTETVTQGEMAYDKLDGQKKNLEFLPETITQTTNITSPINSVESKQQLDKKMNSILSENVSAWLNAWVHWYVDNINRLNNAWFKAVWAEFLNILTSPDLMWTEKKVKATELFLDEIAPEFITSWIEAYALFSPAWLPMKIGALLLDAIVETAWDDVRGKWQEVYLKDDQWHYVRDVYWDFVVTNPPSTFVWKVAKTVWCLVSWYCWLVAIDQVIQQSNKVIDNIVRTLGNSQAVAKYQQTQIDTLSSIWLWSLANSLAKQWYSDDSLKTWPYWSESRESGKRWYVWSSKLWTRILSRIWGLWDFKPKAEETRWSSECQAIMSIWMRSTARAMWCGSSIWWWSIITRAPRRDPAWDIYYKDKQNQIAWLTATLYSLIDPFWEAVEIPPYLRDGAWEYVYDENWKKIIVKDPTDIDLSDSWNWEVYSRQEYKFQPKSNSFQWSQWIDEYDWQLNPQMTSIEWRFMWMVPPWWWKVVLKKPWEYQDFETVSLYVPPEEVMLNVNFGDINMKMNEYFEPEIIDSHPVWDIDIKNPEIVNYVPNITNDTWALLFRSWDDQITLFFSEWLLSWSVIVDNFAFKDSEWNDINLELLSKWFDPSFDLNYKVVLWIKWELKPWENYNLIISDQVKDYSEKSLQWENSLVFKTNDLCMSWDWNSWEWWTCTVWDVNVQTREPSKKYSCQWDSGKPTLVQTCILPLCFENDFSLWDWKMCTSNEPWSTSWTQLRDVLQTWACKWWYEPLEEKSCELRECISDDFVFWQWWQCTRWSQWEWFKIRPITKKDSSVWVCVWTWVITMTWCTLKMCENEDFDIWEWSECTDWSQNRSVDYKQDSLYCALWHPEKQRECSLVAIVSSIFDRDWDWIRNDKEKIMNTDSANWDHDWDKWSDWEEYLLWTDPLDIYNKPADLNWNYLSDIFEKKLDKCIEDKKWPSGDCDDDKLTNRQEQQFWTDPLSNDTDWDSIDDFREVYAWLDPLNTKDGDLDFDWDWILNKDEIIWKTIEWIKFTKSWSEVWSNNDTYIRKLSLMSEFSKIAVFNSLITSDPNIDIIKITSIFKRFVENSESLTWNYEKISLSTNIYLKDTDLDWLSDFEERVVMTDPSVSDTDWDWVFDGLDEKPLDANLTKILWWKDFIDSDWDYLPDWWEEKYSNWWNFDAWKKMTEIRKKLYSYLDSWKIVKALMQGEIIKWNLFVSSLWNDNFILNKDFANSNESSELDWGTDDWNEDFDEDGMTNFEEYMFKTNPNNWDTDWDWISDSVEIYDWLSPTEGYDWKLDNDKDLLSNEEELSWFQMKIIIYEPWQCDWAKSDLIIKEEISLWMFTDPNNKDSDSDWISDGREANMNLDPNNPDTDWDWILDWIELKFRSNPNCADISLEKSFTELTKKEKQYIDSDGDWLFDWFEEKQSKTDKDKKDSDENSVPDWHEDFDQDGLTNFEEQDIKSNPLLSDTDNDWEGDFEEYLWWSNPSDPYSKTLLNNNIYNLFKNMYEKDGMKVSLSWWVIKTLTEANEDFSNALEAWGLIATYPLVDLDQDWFTNLEEQEIWTNPNNYDTDWDKVSDFDDINPLTCIWETDTWSSFQWNYDCKSDTDWDWITNIEEINWWIWYQWKIYYTNYLLDDSDWDELSDLYEKNIGSNPLSPDTDSDWWFDWIEITVSILNGEAVSVTWATIHDENDNGIADEWEKAYLSK